MSNTIESDATACINCGSERVEWVEGYYPSGVTGPNGEQEILHESGWKCDECGAYEDHLGAARTDEERA
jgi:hypothetical protein